MPTQTTFIAGRRNKGGRPRKGGLAGSTATRDRHDDLPPPAPTGMRLRLTMSGGAGLHKQQSAGAPPAITNFASETSESDAVEEQAKEDGELLVTQVETVEETTKIPAIEFTAKTRRSGRVVKKRQDDAFVFGSELDDQVDLSSLRKVDDRADEGEYQNSRSSAPGMLYIQSRGGRGRTSAKAAIASAEVDRELSSKTIFETSSPFRASLEHRRDALTFQPDDRIYQVMGVIMGQPRTQINLPVLADPQSPQDEIPWSAEALMQLYITAYIGGQWNICDLVVDTWIRVFHKIRHRAEKFGDKDEMHMWRINDALNRRRRRGKEGFENYPPNHYDYLKVDDPKLCDDIHDINSGLLAKLYKYTKPSTGLRMVWADSLALCGSKLEHEISRGQIHRSSWHPDLMYDILCTTLRMVGRKLTLKIEEGTEGAWCKRYHEHSKHGLPCYREVAAEEGPAAHFVPAYNVGRGEKRAHEAMDDNEESDDETNGKRACRARDNAVVEDVDAEGESE